MPPQDGRRKGNTRNETRNMTAERVASLLGTLQKSVRNGTASVKHHRYHPSIERLAEYGEGSDCESVMESDEDTFGSAAVNETVTEQPSSLVHGRLKESQLKGLEWRVASVKHHRYHPSIERLAEYGEGSDCESVMESDEDTFGSAAAQTVNEPVTEQPSSLVHGRLKEYQLKGLEWLLSLYNNKRNGILADEMGLGKTVQTIAFVTYLIEKKKNNGPYLVLVPLSTLSNWVMEFKLWAPTVCLLVNQGTPQQRQKPKREMKENFNVVLTTYEYAMRDQADLANISWEYLIVDEGHRLKNMHSMLMQVLSKQYQNVTRRLLLTGTPLQNNLSELWALFNFLHPSIFEWNTTFEQWFNNSPFASTNKTCELNLEESTVIINGLHKVLRPFLLRRKVKDVESQLPEKAEFIIKCGMSGLQRVLYKHMREKGILLTERNDAKVLQNTDVQLRKLCNHPFLFTKVSEKYHRHIGATGAVTGPELYRTSGKFELLDRILPKLKATGHRVLLFCQMTQCMTIIEKYLDWRGFAYLRLDGKTKSVDRERLQTKFNSENSDYFLFLLSTRAAAVGLNLQKADTVVIFDPDRNPQQDLQAQARVHRIGQRNEVRVLRLITVNSVEDNILEATRRKRHLEEIVIEAGMFDQQSTDSERQQFLRNYLTQKVHQDEEEENQVPDDDMINQMIARSDTDLELFNQMDVKRRAQEVQPRLLVEGELPEWLLTEDEQVESQAKEKATSATLGQACRQQQESTVHAKVSEWLNDNNVHALEKVPREMKRKADADTAVDRVKRVATEDNNVHALKKVQREMRRNVDAENTVECTAKGTKNPKSELQEIMKRVLMPVFEHRNSNGENLCRRFFNLPDEAKVPTYYEKIKHPMYMKLIQRRVQKEEYETFAEMESDFHLMCQNAQVFYAATSQEFADIVQLQAVFKATKAEVEGKNLEDDKENAQKEQRGEDVAGDFQRK